MKKVILLLLIIIYSISTFGQKSEFNLIALDSTWGQEVIRFPARHMDYIGVGEIRFPPKRSWIKPEHSFFWSYTYVWNINVNREIPEKELEIALVKYFNSLNKVDMNAATDNRYASAKMTKTKKEKLITYFKGYVKTFDRFATNKRIKLNVLIESSYCKKKQRTFILFKFSPKDFNHTTWKTLKKIKLYNHLCND